VVAPLDRQLPEEKVLCTTNSITSFLQSFNELVSIQKRKRPDMTKEQQNKREQAELIARLQRESRQILQQKIIAPLLPKGRIRTRISGLIHEFRVRDAFVGWGKFQPINEREARVLDEALPWERGGYLELFPALRVLLLWPQEPATATGIWWALPYNESDAQQRFGFDLAPLPVFLCDPTNGAASFERVIARVHGSTTLWFDGPDLRAEPEHAEWLREASGQKELTTHFLPGLAHTERLALLYWRLRQIEHATQQELQQGRGKPDDLQKLAELRKQSRQSQQDWLRRTAEQDQLQARLQQALTKADAQLHSFHKHYNSDGTLQQILVEWSEQGQRRRYRSSIAPDLTVISSGICLDGRDRDFDLTSLVSVMGEAPW
jgi:hypothetical protein